MKEDLICGVAILLYLVLLYLLTTIFIHKNYFEDPFERGKHVIKILDLTHSHR